jgi:hypothetical protein
MAGLACTRKPDSSEFVKEIPVEQQVDVATAFLMWLYRQKFTWTLHLAKELAKFSHFFNIPGMQPIS